MVVAVISLVVLLFLMLTLAARRSRRTVPATYLGRNVVSLDVYRLARLSGCAADPAARPSFAYPLSATSAGGLRTVRQPDGRLARPTARPEPA
jgi:hypothetical protein